MSVASELWAVEYDPMTGEWTALGPFKDDVSRSAGIVDNMEKHKAMVREAGADEDDPWLDFSDCQIGKFDIPAGPDASGRAVSAAKAAGMGDAQAA